MKVELPPILATYFESANNCDIDTRVACFSENATVADEGETRRGKDHIRQWITKTEESYNPSYSLIGVTEEDGVTIVTSSVSGTFDGSPIDLRFFFTLEDGLISSLAIE